MVIESRLVDAGERGHELVLLEVGEQLDVLLRLVR
jgi:hypothetical protein